MGQTLGGLWNRAQGKTHVQRLCNKVFNQFAVKDKLELKDLHLATLMFYISMNKQFLSPYKDPPSRVIIENKIKAFRKDSIEALNYEQFSQTIMEWVKKELRIVFASRLVLALLAAPAMAIMTKEAGKKVPQVRNVAEKVPAPLIAPFYVVALVLLQDMGGVQ